jgi:hypothetical protein
VTEVLDESTGLDRGQRVVHVLTFLIH